MSDQFVEVTHKSWGSRLGDSLKGVLVGIVLFLVAFPVLWWNEGRAVQTYKSLKEGAAAVISVVAGKINPANERRLVHVIGHATTNEAVRDPVFNVGATAIRVSRNVEMYQWTETKKTETRQKVGGGEETTTTFTYDTEWKSSLVNSSSFKKPEGHKNPPTMPYMSESWLAKNVTLGAFALSAGLKEKINSAEPLEVDNAMIARLPIDLRTKTHLADGGFYVGAAPATPKVGDLRVTFTKVMPTDVSVIAAQTGKTFAPYQTKAGDRLEMLNVGTVPPAQMFAEAQTQNVILSWILRIVGFILMLVGLGLVLKPISTLGAVVPFVGDILRMGSGLLAFSVALPLTLLTIGFAWLFYRPVLGVLLLVAGGGIFVGIKMLATKRAPQPASATPAKV